jgi:hypothetical protein
MAFVPLILVLPTALALDAVSIATIGRPPSSPEFSVYPPMIQLDSARDFQGFIGVLKHPDGVTEDVTERALWKVVHGDIARIEKDQIIPSSDGETELLGEFAGIEVRVPIKVVQSQVRPPVSFKQDVVPVLTRSGCNTGSCHGAARGKDGFRISLFGFDPAGDHFRITKEIGIRRINLAVPEESLLLVKACGAVPHTGGKKVERGDAYYKILLEWLQAGAMFDQAEPAAVARVEVYPPQAVLDGSGSQQRMLAVAHYVDGTTRDVTWLSSWSTNNETSAAVGKDGRVTAGERGEAFVMARFDTHTVGRQILALPKDLPLAPLKDSGNEIDRLIYKKLRQLRVSPSGGCTDEEFLRRVTVDIIGLLPTEDQYEAFLNDSSPEKRRRLIDELLDRHEFSEIWGMKFAQLLMVRSSNNDVSPKAAHLYHEWLTDCFSRNVPLDEMVRELLSATGGTLTNPPTNFYQVERNTLKIAENVAQVFMGIQTQCAQCHNHPFDRWTMDDYYGFVGFFSQIRRKVGEDYRETIVSSGGGEARHPVDNRVMPPKFLGGEFAKVDGRDRREVLAEWLTSTENPLFAQSIANRVWAHFMGVGVVEPVDDIRVSNPASNPELFEFLGQRFVDYRFDFRALVRDICNTEAYQRSCVPHDGNRDDSRNYAVAAVRRIPSENLLDCISQATGTKDKFRGLPLGARAVQIVDGRTSTYFLDTFGRSPRQTVCACEATTQPSLSQALHLMNGEAIHGKIRSGKLMESWLQELGTPESVIERLFVRSVSRKPTDTERKELLEQVAAAPNPTAGLEDVFWAVLNSREFVFNH